MYLSSSSAAVVCVTTHHTIYEKEGHDAWVCEDTSSGSFEYGAFSSRDLIPYTRSL